MVPAEEVRLWRWLADRLAGLGCAWVYVVIAMIAGLMWETQDEVYRVAAAILLVLATLALILVSRAKTRGGWRWRP